MLNDLKHVAQLGAGIQVRGLNKEVQTVMLQGNAYISGLYSAKSNIMDPTHTDLDIDGFVSALAALGPAAAGSNSLNAANGVLIDSVAKGDKFEARAVDAELTALDSAIAVLESGSADNDQIQDVKTHIVYLASISGDHPEVKQQKSRITKLAKRVASLASSISALKPQSDTLNEIAR